MSDILHDTLHVWHIDLSYSYRRQTTKTHGKNYAITMQKNAKSRAILRGFHIFSYIFVHISGIFNTPLLRYFAFYVYLFCDCPALSACGMVFKLSSQYDSAPFSSAFSLFHAFS